MKKNFQGGKIYGCRNRCFRQNSIVRIKYFLSAILLALTTSLCAQTPPDSTKPAPFESEIKAFEAADLKNPPPKNGILFIGSSSIRFWATLSQDFPNLPVYHRGFGGSQISDSIHFAPRIVLPYAPRQIVFYAGGNDINADKSPERVFSDFTNFVGIVRAALPETRISYISIAPNPARWKQVEKVKAANRLIADFAAQNPRLDFIDVFSKMLGADGQPLPDIYRDDKLHMNPKGYEIWKGIVGSYLQ